MELPLKYMVLNPNLQTDNYIFEMKLIPMTTELVLVLNVYLLKTKISPGLIQSIQANDSNLDFFNKLVKQPVATFSLNHNQASQTLVTLYQKVQQYVNHTGLITTDFNIKPSLILNLTYIELFNIYTFFNQYAMNYIYYKSEYFKSATERPKTNSPKLDTVVDRPILSIVDKTEAEPEISNDIQLDEQFDDATIGVLLPQALSLSAHNLMTYYLIKYINAYLNSNTIENEYDISIKDNVLTIIIEPLIPNNLLIFSDNHYNDLAIIISNISMSAEEIAQKMIFCFNQLLFLSQKIMSDPAKYKKELHILVKVYDMLFFIYAIKHNPNNFNTYIMNKSNVIYGLHYTIRMFNQYYFNYLMNTPQYQTLPFKQISLIHPLPVTYTANENLDNLKELINKHQYIINTLHDSQKFIEMVLNEFEPKETTKKEVKLILNHPKSIILTNLIDQDSNNLPFNIKTPLMQYKLQNSTQFKIPNKVISEEYLQLLRIKFNDPTLKSSDLHPIISKYGQIISDHILPHISTEIGKKITTPISTLTLLTDYIRPHLSDASSVDSELKIVYRIIIPFLYDIFDIIDYIDYFH